MGVNTIRFSAEMDWALGRAKGAERLMEFEARLNFLIPEGDIIGLCRYRRGGYPPEFLINAPQTHPRLIQNNEERKNNSYVPPGNFLVSECAGLTNGYFFNEGSNSSYRARMGDEIRLEFQKHLDAYALTGQEKKIAEMLISFKSNKDIGESLGISVNTVKQHLKHIYRKIEIKNRMDLIELLLKNLNMFDMENGK